jgi:hypothetical protein
MKMVKYLAIVFLAIGSLTSCKKESGASAADVAKAEAFKAFIAGKEFQVSEYYSDKPIDYVETDTEVKSETNLWPYVSLWIKDDLNSFDVATNKVTIQQGADKIAGNDAATLVFDCTIGADKNGPYFNFLNYLYNPLRYHLVEFTDSYFLVYVDWHSGGKVYTKFSVVN